MTLPGFPLCATLIFLEFSWIFEEVLLEVLCLATLYTLLFLWLFRLGCERLCGSLRPVCRTAFPLLPSSRGTGLLPCPFFRSFLVFLFLGLPVGCAVVDGRWTGPSYRPVSLFNDLSLLFFLAVFLTIGDGSLDLFFLTLFFQPFLD